MSEQQGGLDAIKNRLKNLRPHRTETQQDKSEVIAREAVLLFANQEHQEPLATYYADSQSIFDLEQIKPGSILRVERNLFHREEYPEEPDTMAYQWFVSGLNDKRDTIIFEVSIRNINYYKKEMDTSTHLQLPEPWELTKITPSKQSFPAKDFHRVLGLGIMDNMTKIDVMTAGKAVKEPEKQKVNTQPTLAPVTEAA